MCFFSAIFVWVSSNMSAVATISAVIVATSAAMVAALQLRESRRATQVQVFDATVNKLSELSESFYRENPEEGSEAERHWLNGFFNRLEYMSFLVNERFIPRKLFTRFYSDAFILWFETIFLNKASDEQKNDPQRFSEFKKLYERLKRKTGKPIWEKGPFR